MKYMYMVWLLILAFSFSLKGQDFVYQPKNPAFGGHYLNYTWLLNSANVQDTFEDPEEAIKEAEEDNLLNDFSESLNRQLLNQLTRNLIATQFGEDELTEGSYVFGDFQIDIAPGFEGLVITIFDLGTGGETQVIVPYY